MRHSLLFVPVALVGCAPGRQAAVSNDGRIASTDRKGTFVAGVGKVGPQAEAVAWSPDGSTLAYSTKDGTVVWPKGGLIPRLGGKLAWSLDGRSLAGRRARSVVVWDSTTKTLRERRTLGIPTAIRWMPDGRVLEVEALGFQVEREKRVVRDHRELFDAVPEKDGAIVWLESGDAKRFANRLDTPIFKGRWSPTTHKVSLRRVGLWGTILGTPTPVGLTLITHFALAPGGARYAVAGIAVDTDAKSLARLEALSRLTRDPTRAEEKAYRHLSEAARKRNVLALVEPGKPARVLWSEALTTQEGAPTDLDWSPDGRWLAVARPQGTVRIKVESL